MTESLEFLSKQRVWNQIVENISLSSTRSLIRKEATFYDFVRTANQLGELHVVIRVRVSPAWGGMIRSRLPLIEQSATELLGSAEVLLMEVE